MLLINKGDFVLQSDRRVVKAADVATIRSAAEIVAAAEAQAAQIREDAKAAYEEERKKGSTRALPTARPRLRCRSSISWIRPWRSWRTSRRRCPTS